MTVASCPRCGGTVRPPGLWTSAWQCDLHGDVLPYHLALVPGTRTLAHLLAVARVPVWLPWPAPTGWLVTGSAHAGDERTGARATVVCCSGPGPLGGPADIALIAEEPGVGIGARLAGLDTLDPGGLVTGAPAARVHIDRHPVALWTVPTPSDRCALVGEAEGCWLWLVGWPASAELLVLEQLTLLDLRAQPALVEDLVFGAACGRLG